MKRNAVLKRLQGVLSIFTRFVQAEPLSTLCKYLQKCFKGENVGLPILLKVFEYLQQDIVFLKTLSMCALLINEIKC